MSSLGRRHVERLTDGEEDGYVAIFKRGRRYIPIAEVDIRDVGGQCCIADHVWCRRERVGDHDRVVDFNAEVRAL